MRCRAAFAALSLFALMGCAPTVEGEPIPTCVDGTCDEEPWYLPGCEAQAQAITAELEAEILAISPDAEEPYIVLDGAPFCLSSFLFNDDEGIYQCAAAPNPDHPRGLAVMPIEIEGCGDGICRTDDADMAVCAECFPGDQECSSIGAGPWAVRECNSDHQWEVVETCAPPPAGSAMCDYVPEFDELVCNTRAP